MSHPWWMGHQQLLIIVRCYHIIIDLKISEGGGGVDDIGNPEATQIHSFLLMDFMIINVSILWFFLWGWGHMLIFNYTSVISSWISCLLIWICHRYCDSAYGDGVTYQYSMVTDWFLSWSDQVIDAKGIILPEATQQVMQTGSSRGITAVWPDENPAINQLKDGQL